MARLAAQVADAPVAQVNLVDARWQTPVAAFVAGDVAARDPDAWRTPVTLAASLCQHAVTSGAPFVLDDARTDPRARDSEAVTGAGLVGYCSVPVRAPAGPGAPPGSGPVIGSVCVVDVVPRRWTAAQVAALADLAVVAEAEVARRTAERRLRTLADTLPLVVWTATPEGRTDFLNRRWGELTGQDPVAALAEGTDAYVHPDDLPGIVAAWRRHLPGGDAAGQDFTFEYRLRLRDGSYRWYLGRMVPERDPARDPERDLAPGRTSAGTAQGVRAADGIVRWVGTGTDITEQKQAAEALARANQQLAAQADELASANHQLQDQAVEFEAANQQLQEQAAELEATSEELQATGAHLEEQMEAAQRAAAALERSYAELDLIYRTTPVGLAVLDRELRFVRINDRLAEINGVPAAAHVGRTVREVVPAIADAAEAAFRQVLTSGEPLVGVEITGETPAQPGVMRTWREDWLPLRDAEGAVTGVHVVAEEVTAARAAAAERERLLAETRAALEALAASERQARTVAENATLALFVMDDRQHCAYMNPAAERLTGFTLAELQGRPLHDYIHHTHPDGRPYPLAECPIDQAFPKNDREQGTEVFVHKDGTFYEVAFTASPIRDEATGQPVGTIIEVRDVREERAAAAERERLLAASEAARTALAATQRQLDAALLAGEVGTFEWDIARQRVTGDANFRRMFGIAFDADGWAPLERYIDVIHPEDRAHMRAAVARTVEEGAYYEVEYRVVGRDVGGEPADRTLLVRATPERAMDGPSSPVVRAAGVCLDVSTRARAERRTRQLLEVTAALSGAPTPADVARVVTERLVTLLDVSAASLSILGDDGVTIEVLATHGYDPALAASWRTFPLDAPVPVAAAMRTGEAYYFDTLAAIDHAFPALGAREHMRGMPASALLPLIIEDDLLEDDLLEDDLLEDDLLEGDRLDAEASADGVASGSVGGRTEAPEAAQPPVVGAAVAAARSLRPRRRRRAVGVLGLSYDHECEFDPALRALLEAVARQTAQALDRARSYAAEQAARGAAEQARERATEAQRAAELANAAKGAFLANMSHELRTPLNAIGGYVQLLEMGLHGPVTAEQRSALGRVQTAQTRLLALINDILNYAKLESGRVEYDVRAVDVADVVRDVVPLVEPQFRAKGLEFRVALPTDAGGQPLPSLVWADRDKLGQVLVNLLSNAAKFTDSPDPRTGQPGRVTIDARTRADGDGPADLVFLRVEDSGIGIPRDKQEAVFEPFVQVRARGLPNASGQGGSYAVATEGTGLGLAISRDLARGMGGDLRVRSAEGQGSTFTVALRRVVDAAGHPTDRRTLDERREEERRSGEDRRETAHAALGDGEASHGEAPRQETPDGDALGGGASHTERPA